MNDFQIGYETESSRKLFQKRNEQRLSNNNNNNSDNDDNNHLERINGIVDSNIDSDCKVDKICQPVIFEEPLLDYMAKDYASFVKLILSRFSFIVPDWKEKSAADLTNVLIELLSYIGDHLSYYQDAVSTEAYLGTARKRISIRRHARLLDYFIGEGSNARTWVCIEVDPNSKEYSKGDKIKELVVKKSTKLLTGKSTKDTKISISEDDFKEIISSRPDTSVFETIHDINLYPFHNEMFFYTWGEIDYCLPKGSTHATLLREKKNTDQDVVEVIDSLDIRIFSWEIIDNNTQDQTALKKFMKRISSVFHDLDDNLIDIDKENNNKLKLVDINNPLKFISIELKEQEKCAIAKDNLENIIYEFITIKSEHNNSTEIYGLSLNVGDVLILEEKLSPTTLTEQDRDPSHRQAIKLRQVKRNTDPVSNDNLLEIYWNEEDSLRFPLCVNKLKTSKENMNLKTDDSKDYLYPISVARGNVVLADHGYTITNEELDDVPKIGTYYPKLDKFPITFAVPFIPSASASSSIYIKQEEYDLVSPQIIVKEGSASAVSSNDGSEEKEDENDSGITKWYPRKDLLSSDKSSKEFVVEIDNDGTGYLRFGDGKNGQKPESKHEADNDKDQIKFYASYRIGNGSIGNIGAETIKQIVENKENKGIEIKIKKIFQPLSAKGGTDQESIDEVRQKAPVAFIRQERGVTEDDYSSILQRHPEVRRAVAIFRWTGSWYTVYVTIERIGEKPVDESFKQNIRNYLNKFRLAGYDLEINSPNYVPLEIVINICVKSTYSKDRVKKKLLDIFSTRILEDGQIGFFHPDNFTFGQSLYLSKIYHKVMNMEGIESIFVSRFQRMRKSKNNNIDFERGFIEVHSSEIIRVDNNPNFPNNGKIEFVMVGGIR